MVSVLTDTTLLWVFNNLLTASDTDQICVLALLHLGAAFRTTDHGVRAALASRRTADQLQLRILGILCFTIL